MCTVEIKYVRNMDAVSTSQIADILGFNDQSNNSTAVHVLIHEDKNRIFSEKGKINLRKDKNEQEDTKYRHVF